VTEPVEEPPPAEVVPKPVEPVDPELEIARKNAVLGWALFGLALLLFAGTWAVAYIYLALD
jgi:hypothetical protein